MNLHFESDDSDRIRRVIAAACEEISISVDSEEEPTDTLLAALGFKSGGLTLRLLATVDVDSLSPRDITALAEISQDERCLETIDGVRISRELLDLLVFPVIRARITQHLVKEVAGAKWAKQPEADLYALALTLAGGVGSGLIKVDAIDSVRDLQALPTARRWF